MSHATAQGAGAIIAADNTRRASTGFCPLRAPGGLLF